MSSLAKSITDIQVALVLVSCGGREGASCSRIFTFYLRVYERVRILLERPAFFVPPASSLATNGDHRIG